MADQALQATSSADRVVAEDCDEPTPPGGRFVRLASCDDVRVEMARVYREVRALKLAPEMGTKLIYMLVQLARVTEVATVEHRLREIEALLKQGERNGLEHPK